MKRRIITLFILAPLIAALFVYPRWSSTAVESNAPQQSRPRWRRTRPPASRTTPARDYSKFSHASASHRRKQCSACHETPTANWREVRGFPDVADYPSHASCIECHRQQFFTGARPSICTICHTRVSPREDARPVFPKPSAPSQFTVEFPHDTHQDVIASHAPAPESLSQIRFVRASSVVSSQTGDAAGKRYNNCTICHETNKEPPTPTLAGWRDGFIPAADAFKSSPKTHASCFNCHWKNQEPTKEDCAGCHKISAPHAASDIFSRISIKFTHAREQHTAECTTCHINITRASTLSRLRADVPVTACAACHKTSTDRTAATIETELEQRKKDSNFTCAKCHTSDVGGKRAPASHYALFSD